MVARLRANSATSSFAVRWYQRLEPKASNGSIRNSTSHRNPALGNQARAWVLKMAYHVRSPPMRAIGMYKPQRGPFATARKNRYHQGLFTLPRIR